MKFTKYSIGQTFQNSYVPKLSNYLSLLMRETLIENVRFLTEKN